MKTPIEMLNAIIEMQEENYGNGIKTKHTFSSSDFRFKSSNQKK
tara:strand:+ start:544 stop:675 length:132 start_codon:yes stop_codon:yes gene_type:complete